ncbi:MAG: O-antigen ligase family protein [Patescibacteria group bacterium]|jgi:O-antigen ligase
MKISNLVAILPGLTILYLIKLTIFGLPTNWWEILVYLCAFVFLFIKKSTRLKKSEIASIALITLITLIATYTSPEKREALGIIKGWIVPAILLYWMLKNAWADPKNITLTIKAMVYQGILVALVAILQTIPAISNWWITRAPDLAQYLNTGRYTSIFNSPNSAAMILAPALILALYCHFDPGSWLERPRWPLALLADRLGERNLKKESLPLLASLVIIIGLVLTHSRGGIVAAIIGIALLALSRFDKISRAWAVVIAALSLLIFNPIILSLSALNDPNHSDIRILIWQKSWQMVSQHPIWGIGLGHFHQAFASFTLHQPNFDEFITPYALHPHNVILYVWLSFGIIGLIGLIGLIGASVRAFLRDKSPLRALGFALLVVMLTQGMVDTTIFKNDLIIWFIIAVLLTFRQSENTK